MIDSFRRRRPHGHHIRPVDKHLVSQMVVGGRSSQAEHHAPSPAHHGHSDHFASPHDVEAAEEQRADTNTTTPILHRKDAEKRSFKNWLKSRTKKQWVIIGIIAALVVAGLGVGAYFLFRKEPAPPAPAAAVEPPAPPAPTTVASNLTGLQVDPSVNERPVTGVMIENSTFARPQSGIIEAGVVFEAIAEGGITRLLALYQDYTTPYIGPVRSVRPYYVQWGMGFDAAIAHAGGSADGLALVRTTKDLDQFANPAYYHRVSNREAPHNLYTSIADLNALEQKKGYGASKYTGFQRKSEEPAKTPEAKTIDLTISGYSYNTHYEYDTVTNTYKRFQTGTPFWDVTENGAQNQVAPKSLVVLVMSQGSNGVYTTYQTIGSGPMYAFQDGKVVEGTWKKNSNSEQFIFTNLSNEPIKLNNGQTWVTAVGSKDRVVYKP